MKLLPIVLLNVATVGVGLVAYDQLRGDGAPSGLAVESARTESAALEPRIEALEAERRPILGGGGIDPRILERLDELEDALRAQVAIRQPVAEEAIPTEDGSPALKASPEGVSPDEVRRWRKVRDAVRRQEKIDRNRKRFDKALDDLSMSLTPRQREKIYAAHAAFEPRIQEIWGEIKANAQATIAAGGTIDRESLGQQGMAQIQQEFAETLSGIVHQADAEAVSEAMLSRGK